MAQMREPWPEPDDAVQMPVEELALRVLDRIASTPVERLGMLRTRQGFVSHEAMEAERKQTRRPGRVTVTHSQDALVGQQAVARAYGEAWDLCVRSGWFAEDPTNRGSYVSRLGTERLETDVPSSRGSDG